MSACGFAGIALGILYVRLFIPRPDMGWDGIADMLGGMMLGALLGLVAGVVLFRLLQPGRRIRASMTATGIGLLTFAGLIATAPKQAVSPAPAIKQAFQPAFRFSMRVSHAEEILANTPANAQPLPFTEAQIASGKPVLVYKTWGPDFAECNAQPDTADLEVLVAHILALDAASGSICSTPEEDLLIAASWRINGTQGNQSIEAGCLASKPAFRAASEALTGLAENLCPALPTPLPESTEAH